MNNIKLLMSFTAVVLTARVYASDVLPIPTIPTTSDFNGKIGLRMKDSIPAWPKSPTAPKDAPNVVIIMLDDAGFGASSTFGGPVPTPNFDRIAKDGLKYTQFHTTALSSPTRAALLTGRNHHSAHTGTVPEASTGYPGYDSIIGKDTATIGEILKQNGYSTAWFGKHHNVPDWETSAIGPFDHWPIGLGFEYFYGFIGGETNQWTPLLYENINQIQQYIGKSGYNLNDDLADKAIAYIQKQNSMTPDKPFFIYYVPGATHAPHHAPKEWIAKFKDKFDYGWDKQRELTFAKQKQMGIIPKDAKLTPRPKEIPAWDSFDTTHKKIAARMMEVYAAYLSQTDYEVGRILDEIDKEGKKDNTLIILLIGDNGAAGDSINGLASELSFFNKIPEDSDKLLKNLDELGGPRSYSNYPVGWALAMDTPFQWTKGIASHYGGTRNPMVISWPNRIKQVDQIRTQWHHVIDIFPTILEAVGLQMPAMVNGVAQKPLEGVSMVYTWDNPKAKSLHAMQYFEMFGNRAIYYNGWIACTTPPASLLFWLPSTGVIPDVIKDYKWELYNVDQDYSEADNLASQMPEKLKEMQYLFYAEAAKYNVFPLNNEGLGSLAGSRPSLSEGRKTFVYYDGMAGISEGSAPNLKNKSFTITADLEIPEQGASGTIITQGGRFNGWSLFMKDNKIIYHYNLVRAYQSDIISKEKTLPGKHIITFAFKYDDGGIGKGGIGTILVDGKKVGEGHLEKTIGYRVSLDETLDIGEDIGTAASDDYVVPFKFTGKINSVKIQLNDNVNLKDSTKTKNADLVSEQQQAQRG